MDIVKKIKNFTYNQRHCLGQGSFGRVYEGKSDEGLKVAIKRVEQSMISKDKYLKASLESEINIMRKLKHPNIVKLFDVVTTNNSIYLVMEFCAGGDLKRYCRNRKISEDQATNIIKNIVQAFQHIVQIGIIHRDLKPANILVHEGVFKVCDFGFAKFFKDSARMTRTCVGTPIYMSPQVLAQKNYTDKTDVWSLGVLFYELLFGKLPYYGSTEDALYKAIMKAPLAIPPCSNFTMTLLKGMLEIQESKRFSWNKVFEMFGLPTVQNQNQVPQKQYNGFYKPVQPENIMTERVQRPQSHNYYNTARNSGYNPYSAQQQLGPHKKPQKRPINPLAFQNPLPQGPQQPQVPVPVEEPVQKRVPQDPSSENPRFLYFVLIELIVQPLKSCPSYPQLIAALYRRTEDTYRKFIDREKTNTLYSRILASELEELGAIKSEIPHYPSANLEIAAESVIREATENRISFNGISWVQKLLSRNYSYQR